MGKPSLLTKVRPFSDKPAQPTQSKENLSDEMKAKIAEAERKNRCALFVLGASSERLQALSRRVLQASIKKPKTTESFKQKKRKGGKADKALAVMEKLEAKLEKQPKKELRPRATKAAAADGLLHCTCPVVYAVFCSQHVCWLPVPRSTEAEASLLSAFAAQRLPSPERGVSRTTARLTARQTTHRPYRLGGEQAILIFCKCFQQCDGPVPPAEWRGSAIERSASP